MSSLFRSSYRIRIGAPLRFLCGTVWCLLAISASAQTVNVAAAANGGVATASSVYDPTYGPSKTIDGDRNGVNWTSGGGWNDATGGTFPDWLQVNFSGPKIINEIDVFTLQDGMASLTPTPAMTFTQYGITAFQVQYWDGAAWLDVPGGNVTGNNLVWRQFTFTSIITDRIRVLVNGSASGWSSITEVEAWASVFANMTAPATNTVFSAPATVSLSATGGDTLGALSKVEFYRDAVLIATVTSPSSGTSSLGSYTAGDSNVLPGTYSYTAKAYDSNNPNLVAVSPPSVVSVSAAVGAVNVAAASNGGVATASSTYQDIYAPSKAIDGQRYGNWTSGGGWNDATGNTFPDWLQVTFNGVQSIGEIDVFGVQDAFGSAAPTPTMTFTQYGLTAFQVQYWDGTSWTDVPGGNVTGNNLVWRKFTFAPISTDRIRVLVNDAPSGYSSIVEVEAWTNIFANLTAVANNAVLQAPATVNLTATAGDALGPLGKVEFYRDGTLIATVTTPSSGTTSSGTYIATDPDLPAGTYTYTVKAYDSANPSVVAVSAPAAISISAGAGAINVAAAANGGVATASSVYQDMYGPSKTIDGQRSGDWTAGGGWNDSTQNAYPDWLQVNFSGMKTIGEIDVFTLQDGMGSSTPTPTMTFTQYGITAFHVQHWNGAEWLDVPGGNVTGNNLIWRRFTFAPITTDRIRVLVNGSASGWTSITEVEAWSVATLYYQIGGTVTANGGPLAGVTFAATNGGACTPSDANGQYSCSVAQGWSGSVTPSIGGYTFAPASRAYSEVQAGQTGQDFAVGGTVTVRVYHIDVDHLNTPRLVSDQAGNPVWRNDNTEPFGDSVPNTDPNNAGTAFDLLLRFPGQYFDRETNLTYNMARDYWPTGGRYVESDPIGLRGGLNSYAYVAANPLSFVDSRGLDNPGMGPYGPRWSGVTEPGIDGVCVECLFAVPPFLRGPLAIARACGMFGRASADEVPASTPVGRRGSPMDVERGTNSPSSIGGRDFDGHALDQMQGRGVTPSVVEDTIATGARSPGNTAGTTVFESSKNGVSVVVNSDGKVVTVITTPRR